MFRKVKELPLETPIIGLHVKILFSQRSNINLLNKGWIVGIWDEEEEEKERGWLPKRKTGIWLSTRDPKHPGRKTIYPCFLDRLSDILEFQYLE